MSRTSRRSSLCMRLLAAAILVFAGAMTSNSARAASITPQAALVRVLTVTPIQPAWFAPSFLAQISVVQVQQVVTALTTQLGPYQSVTARPDGTFQVRFKHGTADVQISLDAKGRIDGLAVSNPKPTGAASSVPGKSSDGTPRAALVRVLTVTPIQSTWFAPSFLAQLSVTQIRQIKARIAAEFGPCTGVSAAPSADGSYLVQFKHGTASAQIQLDSKGRIAALQFTFLQLTGARWEHRTPRAALAHLFTVSFIPSSWFVAALLAQVSVVQIQQIITGFTEEYGPYRGVTVLPHGVYQVRFQDGTATAQIHLDSQHRIDSLGFTQLHFTVPMAPKSSSSPAVKAAALDALLSRLARDHTFSGSVLVALHGRVILGKGYGYADLAHSVPNTINTEFRIGSVSKQFTAMGILQLQEAGKLSIHDHLCKYIAACPTAWKPITLQQLLTHTSGLPNYTSLPSFAALVSSPTTAERVIALLAPLPLDFAPGAQYEYSNSNFFLLGAIIAKVAGEPYASYLQQHVFDPLLMQQTGYDQNHPDLRQHASGYSTWASPGGYWDMSWAGGAGALYSTVVDLWRWDQALTNDTLISKASTADMFAAHATACTAGGGACLGFDRLAYGYGWVNGTIGSHLVIWHNGEIPGYKAMNAFLPREGITVVVLSNVESSGADDIGVQLVKMMLGQA